MREEQREKLIGEKDQLSKLLKTAASKRKGYEARLAHGVACQTATFFGDVVDKMQNNMRARYHWARWVLAETTIRRRMERLQRKLRPKRSRDFDAALANNLEKAKPDHGMAYVQQPITTTAVYQDTGGTALTWATTNWVVTSNTTG